MKKERVSRLLALSKEIRKAYEEPFYGRKMPVLFEDFDAKKEIAYGHTENYLLLAIPSEVPLHGQILDVEYNASTASD